MISRRATPRLSAVEAAAILASKPVVRATFCCVHQNLPGVTWSPYGSNADCKLFRSQWPIEMAAL